MAQWLHMAIGALLFAAIAPVNAQDTEFNLTFIENAIERGAVCLDGTPGAYYFANGFGSGVNNWIVQLKGGAWCESAKSCLDRSKIDLGSTKNASAVEHFGTILSRGQASNPEFYNWNKVYVLYCDGASFMGDVEEIHPETKLYRRGRRIFTSVLEDLLATKGMNCAENALLYGSSAGGLATIQNCDRFRSYLPFACRVKCFSDSGFFIRAKELQESIADDYYRNVVEFHELANVLPEPCTFRLAHAPHLCLFPENIVGDIQTPLFLLNTDFDQYQISANLKPNPPDDKGWKNCTAKFRYLENCTATQLQLIMDFQIEFLKTLEGVDFNPLIGLFIDSCFVHDFVARPGNWQGRPTVQNLTIEEAFGEWYFENRNIQFIEEQRPYPTHCLNATD